MDIYPQSPDREEAFVSCLEFLVAIKSSVMLLIAQVGPRRYLQHFWYSKQDREA